MITGFPGFTATPWTIIPGLPSRSRTCSPMSRAPTELPPEKSTMSQDFMAFWMVSEKVFSSSLMMPYETGRPPVSRTSAAMFIPFISRIFPGGGCIVWETISSPVEITATRTCLRTKSPSTPIPARRPRSCGRSRCPAGRRGAPFLTSSPAAMTFDPIETGRVTSIILSSTRTVCSSITTASAPGGIKPPVAIL